ncbi:MAG: gamma-glutamylcyclotransferase [Planctomycetes bacterium]|nr:gamma-glutamylcyclotransferase [Planctomycetota bacterium]
MLQMVNAIFVYGTLQRGEQRERCWPRKPSQIEWGAIQGELRDLGEYPALVIGESLILGELWSFVEADIEATLAMLDEIEGYSQDDDDLYVREVVACRTLQGEARQAFTYRYANPQEIAMSPIILPDTDGFCRWTHRCRGGR